MVSSELAPIAKVGGLADMVTGLSLYLHGMNINVSIICPLHECIPKNNLKRVDGTFKEEIFSTEFEVYTYKLENKVDVYLIDSEKFFGKSEIYTPNSGQSLGEKYGFFCFAASVVLKQFINKGDIIHCHDWMTGLIPLIAKENLIGVKSVLTLHNMAHQGEFNVDEIKELENFKHYDLITQNKSKINFLATGIEHTTKLTTVSKQYAKEILLPEYGMGLEVLLQKRKHDLLGITNGIYGGYWDPSTDEYLTIKYDIGSTQNKSKIKQALEKKVGLKSNPETPLFISIARLYSQKGIDLFADALDKLLVQDNFNTLIIGQGDPKLEEHLKKLENKYKGRFTLQRAQSEQLVHEALAAGDFLVMPSRYEPCGLVQLYAMKYGCVPIVSATGGLVDTVQPRPPNQTGYWLKDISSASIESAIFWGLETYQNTTLYHQLQINAMQVDFSWSQTGHRYLELYRAV